MGVPGILRSAIVSTFCFLILAALPASADAIVLNVEREIQVRGVASAGAIEDSFDTTHIGPNGLGPFNDSLTDSAEVYAAGAALPVAWTSATATQNSDVQADLFLASGVVTAIAGTVEDPDYAFSAVTWPRSNFEATFQLTAPTWIDLTGFHSALEQGAANPFGGVALQGDGVNLFFVNQAFDVHQLLLPGVYTLTGRASVTCSSLPGVYGGESTIVEEYDLSLALQDAQVPEPATVVLLGLGVSAMAAWKAKRRV